MDVRKISSFLVLAVLAVFLTVPSAPALASGGGGHNAEAGGHSEKKKPPKKEEFATITSGEGDGEIYLHLTPITFPIIGEYGSEQLVSMLVDLQMKDRASAESLQKKMPKLKDSLIVALYGFISDEEPTPMHLDIPMIKRKIINTINNNFEKEHVTEVYIQGIAQRKL
ncbi:MAG: hypothetical protein EOM37_00320 [Proteobacteria bacterium]|jgi:flagellar basal body-associated protein FliL|nr:hypothetical protein [Alphaproteobacteria bacterium]NCC02484.1 hypothetical protein [Pseudomonadota bacterium]